MPGEYADGTYTSVTLKVNGETLPTPITFNTYGWQSANTTGNVVALNKGENTVQFISGSSDVPVVREVRKINRGTDLLEMHNLTPISISNLGNAEVLSRGPYIDRVGYYYSNPEEPLYRPGVSLRQRYYYTTNISIYYENAGDVAHFYAPTSWDPMFGQYESSIDYNAYFFYKADPLVYSKRFSTTNHYISWSDIVPVAGEYCLILEPKNINESGYASIRINNSNLYRGCYVAYNNPTRIKLEDNNNYIMNSPQDSIFNMFTTNNGSLDSTVTHEPDPVLYLKQRMGEGSDARDLIVAYSDNNTVRSDFDWGKNARIRTTIDSTKQYYLTLASNIPYVQPNNPDYCDLYHSYWNNIDTMRYISIAEARGSYYKVIDGDSILVSFDIGDTLGYFSKYYPNIIAEDLIESGKSNVVYNCYAWSAGIMYNTLNVSGNDNLETLNWFDLIYSNQDFENEYGKTRRPPGSPIYTREGATFENAVVDIWGDITENNDTIITHVSVRNPYSGIPNGYDWESKRGGDERIFHPRMADLGYGYIVAHYTLAPGQDTVQYSYEGIVYSAIASGEMIIEDVKLTDKEESLLSQNIPIKSTYSVNRFEQYYNQWKEYAKTKFHYSDFEFYKDTVAYPRLVNYILSNPGEEYKVYKKFNDGDYFSAVLIKDISSVEGSRAKRVWDRIMTAPLDGNILRTSWGNVRLFIKTMLQDEEDTLPQTGVVRSNEDDVEVIASTGEVTITIGLKEASKYSITAVNVKTSQQFTLLPESKQQKGERIYQYSLPSGTYIIAVVVNGNINAKKVIVK